MKKSGKAPFFEKENGAFIQAWDKRNSMIRVNQISRYRGGYLGEISKSSGQFPRNP
jgi:hypothetical protein